MTTTKPCVRVVIPGVPPSANKLLRMHWGQKGREKDSLRSMISHLVQAKDAAWLRSMAELKKRMKVTIIVRTEKLDDPDNLPARAKLILDVMKPTKTLIVKGKEKTVTGLGFIFDDSCVYCETEVQQEQVKGLKETVLSICEAPPLSAEGFRA